MKGNLKALPRPLPFGWFNYFMDFADNVLRERELALTLVEKALDGTLLMYALCRGSCGRSNIYLIDAEPLHEYSQEEAKELAIEFSVVSSQQDYSVNKLSKITLVIRKTIRPAWLRV